MVGFRYAGVESLLGGLAWRHNLSMELNKVPHGLREDYYVNISGEEKSVRHFISDVEDSVNEYNGDAND